MLMAERLLKTDGARFDEEEGCEATVVAVPSFFLSTVGLVLPVCFLTGELVPSRLAGEFLASLLPACVCPVTLSDRTVAAAWSCCDRR
jgi:hypothetical protein